MFACCCHRCCHPLPGYIDALSASTINNSYNGKSSHFSLLTGMSHLASLRPLFSFRFVFSFSFVVVVLVVVVVILVQDIDDLQNFGLVHQVDYIAASFVRKAEDIDTIRMVLGEEGAHMKVRNRTDGAARPPAPARPTTTHKKLIGFNFWLLC